MERPRPWWLPLAGALSLPLLLSGCSGTPFGEGLARSFSRPPATPAAAPRTPVTASPAATTTTLAPATRTPAKPPATTAAGKPSVTPSPMEPSLDVKAPPAMKPAPYRVTIRLPEADPSAPAEVVTRALRAAGVPFEVETIERMTNGGSVAPVAPVGAAAAPTPTSRPAPAPR